MTKPMMVAESSAMAPDLLTLDADQALDVSLVGGKAAWLARGRRHGLPILPGAVISARQSRGFVDRASRALERRGSGGARLSVATAEVSSQLMDRLRGAVSGLGSPFVVRSSTSLDASGEWAGAFASYRDVAPDELDTAVKGCWASLFTPSALARFTATGIEPGSVAMAVLVQPEMMPEAGGTGRIVGSEAHIVSGTAPADIVQGREPGALTRLDRSGTMRGDSARGTLDESLLRRIAALLFEAGDLIGATSLEWLVAADEVVILQLDRHAVTELVPAPPRVMASDSVVSLTRLLRRYPGQVGSQLILRWAVACPELACLDVPHAGVPDPAEAWRDAVAMAAHLTAQVWGDGDAAHRADANLDLLEVAPMRAAAVASELPRPDQSTVHSLLGLVSGIEMSLLASGRLARRGDLWRLQTSEAERLLAGGRGRTVSRYGVDRWEPITTSVVSVTATATRGIAASEGLGSGRLCVVANPADAQRVRSRDVIVAAQPIPHLAPLLWDAAGLITIGGGPGAHLFESARALGLPAVAGCGLEQGLDQLRSAEWVAAVDGTVGQVMIAPW